MLPYIPEYPIIKDCILITENEIELAHYDNNRNLFHNSEGKLVFQSEIKELVNILIEGNTRIIKRSFDETIKETFNNVNFYDSAMDCFFNNNCPFDEEIIKSFHNDEIIFI